MCKSCKYDQGVVNEGKSWRRHRRIQLLLLKLKFFHSFQTCLLTEGKPQNRGQTMKIVDEKNQGQLGARPAVGLLHCPESDCSSLQQLDMSLSLCQDCCKQLEGHPSPFLSLANRTVSFKFIKCGWERKKKFSLFLDWHTDVWTGRFVFFILSRKT